MLILKKCKPKIRETHRGGHTFGIGFICGVPMSAFIGTTDLSVTSFGIGLIDDRGEIQFWEADMSYCLATMWRGLRVLEKVTYVSAGALRACCCAGKRIVDEEEARYMRRLAGQIPNFEQVREELLSRLIPEEELEEILDACDAIMGKAPT